MRCHEIKIELYYINRKVKKIESTWKCYHPNRFESTRFIGSRGSSVYIGQWLASSRVPCHLEAIARRYCRLSVGSPLSSIEWWSNHLRVPLFLCEPVNSERPSGLPDFHADRERTNERTGRGKRRRRWRRDDENRAWNATLAFSAGFSLALKEGGTLVKNCRSRGTSREGSRFFRWLGRVTSSSDPRDHCLRSLPPQSASNGCPRSPLERATAIDRLIIGEFDRGIDYC